MDGMGKDLQDLPSVIHLPTCSAQVSTWRFNFLFDPQKDFFAQVVLGGEIDGGPDRVIPSP